jgi:hypothetical protein
MVRLAGTGGSVSKRIVWKEREKEIENQNSKTSARYNSVVLNQLSVGLFLNLKQFVNHCILTQI